MKTLHKISIGAIAVFMLTIVFTACSSTKDKYVNATEQKELIIEKSGAQYWGETCNRCHLAPSPADYNDADWETISLHMRVRANLTEKEVKKIEAFLKSAN